MESIAGSQLISSNVLQDVLLDLSQNSYPHVPNPQGCPKRASVALILRIRPHASCWPAKDDATKVQGNSSSGDPLKSFFSIPWVHHGDAEVLFIKRAARVGDRWTSHVAFPGGKRDPEDLDDRSTAIRETSEEIGLDIGGDETIFVGNLPERVVTTSWGTIPFVFAYARVFIANLDQSHGPLSFCFCLHSLSYTSSEITTHRGCFCTLDSNSGIIVFSPSNFRVL